MTSKLTRRDLAAADYIRNCQSAYAAYTYLYNLTGQPSAAVPAGVAKNGLPVSILLSARSGEDGLLLSICAELERAVPWFDSRPPL